MAKLIVLKPSPVKGIHSRAPNLRPALREAIIKASADGLLHLNTTNKTVTAFCRTTPALVSEMAKSIDPRNRTPVLAYVRKHVYSIKNRLWASCHVAPYLFSHKHAVDGGHRIQAMVIADEDLSDLIVELKFNVPVAHVRNTDTGRPRTLGQQLVMFTDAPPWLGAIMGSFIVKFKEFAVDLDHPADIQIAVSALDALGRSKNTEISRVEWYARHHHELKHGFKQLGAIVALMVYSSTSKQADDNANEWIKQFRRGVTLGASHPFKKLFQKFQRIVEADSKAHTRNSGYIQFCYNQMAIAIMHCHNQDEDNYTVSIEGPHGAEWMHKKAAPVLKKFTNNYKNPQIIDQYVLKNGIKGLGQ